MRRWRSAVPAALVLLTAAGIGACSKNGKAPLSPQAQVGAVLAQSKGCLSCHSTNGQPRMGPTFKGLLGSSRTLSDFSEVVADEAYIRRSITDPAAQVIIGATTAMPKVDLTDEQVSNLVAYITSL